MCTYRFRCILQLFVHPPSLSWWRATLLSNSVLVRDYIIFKILCSLACSICPTKFYSIRLGSQWPMLTATPAGSRCSRTFPASLPSMFCLSAEQRRSLPPSPLNQKCIHVAREFPIRAGEEDINIWVQTGHTGSVCPWNIWVAWGCFGPPIVCLCNIYGWYLLSRCFWALY